MARPKVNHERSETRFIHILLVVLPLLTFAGGLAVNTFILAEKVATKPYVDERAADLKKYSDERAATTLKEAFEHSDMNRQLMALEIEKSSSVVKALDVKIDSLNIMMERLYKEVSARSLRNK